MGLEQRPRHEGLVTRVCRVLETFSPELRARGREIRKRFDAVKSGEITNQEEIDQLLHESYQWRQDVGKFFWGD